MPILEESMNVHIVYYSFVHKRQNSSKNQTKKPGGLITVEKRLNVAKIMALTYSVACHVYRKLETTDLFFQTIGQQFLS